MAVIHIKNPGGQGEIVHTDSSTGDNIQFDQASTECYSVDVNGLPDTTSNQQYMYYSCCVGDIAADSDAIVPYLIKRATATTIYAAYISVDTDIGDDDSNYQTIQLVDSGSNNILDAGFTTDVAWTGGTPISLGALSAHAVLTADESAYATFTKTSSGKAMVAVTFHFICTLEA